MAQDTAPLGKQSVNTSRIGRVFEGVVVSAAMEKTIVVRVDRVRVHRLYGKRFSISRRFKVHDEHNTFKEGDLVRFIECRPLSKDKRWRVLGSERGQK